MPTDHELRRAALEQAQRDDAETRARAIHDPVRRPASGPLDNRAVAPGAAAEAERRRLAEHFSRPAPGAPR